MRIIKYFFFLLLILSLMFTAYIGTALALAGWYPDLDLNTTYSVAYFEKKLNSLTKEFYAHPLKEQTITLTDQECEGILRLAVKRDPQAAAYIKGFAVAMEKDVVELKANIEAAGRKKGIRAALKPVYIASSAEFQVEIKSLHLGNFPLPVKTALYLLERLSPREVPVQIENGILKVKMGNLPLDLKHINIGTNQITVGLAVSSAEIARIAGEQKKLVQEAFSQTRVIKDSLASTEAKDFINSLQGKQTLLPEDITKAQEIYDKLSPQDKAVLEKNLGALLDNPEIKKALEKYMQ